MVTAIERGEVQRLLGEGAQLVEVLPAEQYEQLPAGRNQPAAEGARSRRSEDSTEAGR
jgi:hypothetical protein